MNATARPAPALPDVRQVAERLGVSASTVRRLWDAGDLPSVKVRRRLLWVATEVDAYVRRLQGKGATL